MTEELTVTSAAEFRSMREQGVLQTIPPAGRVVRLRTVTPDRLLRLGKLPDILTKLVIKMFYEGVSPSEFNKFLEQREIIEEILEQVESLRVVCTAGLLEPRIVDNPQGADEISIDDLSMAERGWIFRLVLQEAEFLATFRHGQTPDVEAVPDVQNDGQPPQ